PAPHEIPLDSIAHRLGDDEPEAGGVARIAVDPVDERAGARGAPSPAHDRAEVRGLDHSVRPGQHVSRLRGELGAPLATAGGQDGTAGARAHTETEAVLLGTTPVVRLEGSLAHGDISWPRCVR